MAELRINIGITGTVREKVLAVMHRIRPALAGGLKDLLISVANAATKRASGDVLRVRTGHLRRSIGPARVTETTSGASGELTVSAKYAPALEYGTKPYTIRARHGKALRFIGRGGKPIFRRSVNHPGIRPHPFFQPSWDENMEGGKAKARLTEILKRTINEA